MARKAMETALKMVAPEINAPNIAQRIESASAKLEIPNPVKTWAHGIRSLGADAAHDLDPFSKEEALSILEFVEVFLEYLFTMPEKVRAHLPQK